MGSSSHRVIVPLKSETRTLPRHQTLAFGFGWRRSDIMSSVRLAAWRWTCCLGDQVALHDTMSILPTVMVHLGR